MSAEVPTIDLSHFCYGSGPQRTAVVESIRACCHEGVGFFYLVNHGISPRLLEEVEAIVHDAFALPLVEKARIDKSLSPQFRGWEQAGLEYTQGQPDTREQVDTWTDSATLPATAAQTSASDALADPTYTAKYDDSTALAASIAASVDSPDISTPHAAATFNVVHGAPSPPGPGMPPPYLRLLGTSQYFADDVVPGYRRVTTAWMAAYCAVCESLLEAFSLALGLRPEALHTHFGDPTQRQSLIKYIHYPPTPAGGQGVGLHQDSQFLTLLLPGVVSGLEAQLPSGEFVGVGRVEGAFVVNLGECMQLLTGAYFLATPHRVMAAEDRYSIAFFYGPTLDTPLTPPLCLGPAFSAAVQASERHRRAGTMPTKEELAAGVRGSYAGAVRHHTYGELLWRYFARAHPAAMARHYPDDGDGQ